MKHMDLWGNRYITLQTSILKKIDSISVNGILSNEYANYSNENSLKTTICHSAF